METINQIMVICGWIITLGGAGTVIYNAYKRAKKPKDDIEGRLTSVSYTHLDVYKRQEYVLYAQNVKAEQWRCVMEEETESTQEAQ